MLGGFLSCLCGSEPGLSPVNELLNFLSCLCGSEQPTYYGVYVYVFLSCLCGSEQSGKVQKNKPHLIKIRISAARPKTKHARKCLFLIALS